MEYYSIKRIRDEFGIDSESPDEIRKELMKRIFKIHPDKNKGEFSSEKEKEDYLKINSAITFLDEQAKDQKALTPLKDVTDLITTVKGLVLTNNESKSAEKLRIKIDDSIDKLKHRNQTPKIAASTITAIVTILWVFPSTVQQHPILSMYINPTDIWFTIIWLYSLMLTTMLWWILRRIENREAASKKRLNLESVQNSLFEEFINTGKHTAPTGGQVRFLKAEFVKFLTRQVIDEVRLSPMPFRFLSPDKEMDLELPEALAKVILNRAEVNGYIGRDKGKNIDDMYVVDV